jgi:tRNA threonylcarbamoyl adenosine modification protein YjeE
VDVGVADLASFRLTGEVMTLPRLREWAHAIGRSAPLPVVLTLDGPLGAGKTTVAQSIAEGAGAFDLAAVTSPTFALIHEYEAARGAIAHLDLYRLSTAREVEGIGFDAVLERSKLVMIEWSDRATALLAGQPRLAITLDYVSSDDLSHRMVRCALLHE